MDETLHYLLMADHLLFQKSLLEKIRDTGLSPGQPKILDYLLTHDGTMQREIADSCQIEPATLTALLLGMEKGGLIIRKNREGNRRSLYVYLTPRGATLAAQVESCFSAIECAALSGFCQEEQELLKTFLTRINKNMKRS